MPGHPTPVVSVDGDMFYIPMQRVGSLQSEPTPSQQSKMENCLLRRDTMANFVPDTWGDGAHPVADSICFYDSAGEVHMVTDTSSGRCMLDKDPDVCQNGADQGVCMSHITEDPTQSKTKCRSDPSCKWYDDDKGWMHASPRAVWYQCTSTDDDFKHVKCDATYYDQGWWEPQKGRPNPTPQQCTFSATIDTTSNVPEYTMDDKQTCPHKSQDDL